MSRNSAKRSTQQTPEVVSEVKPETKPETKTETKVEARPKKTKKDTPVTTTPVTPVTPVTPALTASDSVVPSTSTRRPPPTRESIEAEFDDLIGLINSELETLRTSPDKVKGSRFLRTIGKRLKTLKTRSLRITKQKNGNRRNNANSGFLKPVPISKELASFTSWSPSELHSRVDVTKFICTYVKDHDLQDPEDRRRILVDKNPKLKALLGFQGESPALRYCDLQTHLKQHFPVQQKTQLETIKETPEPKKPRKARA